MITLKHDHKLTFPTITVPMISQDEEDDSRDIQQTNVEGIMVPLFRFNNTTISFTMVQSMRLTCNPIPQLELEILDSTNMIKNWDSPGLDNILYMQILPPFDNAYRKIQLAFRMSYINISGSLISIRAEYSCPNFFNTIMKAYGMVDTWHLFEEISNDLSLGFASNIDGIEDKRYIYNPNLRPAEFMNREIEFGGSKEHVLDWWIDLWNNINLVDIYEEYNSLQEEKDMKIWISTTIKDFDKGTVNEPHQITAAFTNHPTMLGQPLFISDYIPIVEASRFTDTNFETYSMQDQELSSTLIQDGDVQNNYALQYQYGGEKFGEFDYLGQRMAREHFRSKMYGQSIEVTVGMPMLGIIKGDKVNVWWYDINSYMTENADDTDVGSNTELPDSVLDNENSFIINKTISGQYYVLDINFEYNKGTGWRCTYKLGRSAENIQRLNPPTNESFNK